MPVALDGERLGLVELLERAGEIGARHGVGIVDHIEDRIVGLKVRDLYEVPAAAIVLAGAQGAREAGRDDPPEHVQAADGRALGVPGLRGTLVRAVAGRPERLHGLRQRAGDRRRDHAALQGQRAPGRAQLARTPSTTRRWPASASPAACSPSRPALASSSSGRFSREWHTTYETGETGEANDDQGIHRARLGRVAGHKPSWPQGSVQNRTAKLAAAATVALVADRRPVGAKATKGRRGLARPYSGSVKRKRFRRRRAVSTQMRPPWASTTLAGDREADADAFRARVRRREQHAEDAARAGSGSTPTPLSRTLTTQRPSSNAADTRCAGPARRGT